MLKKHTIINRIALVFALFLSIFNPLIVNADTGPTKETLNITWPDTNTFICDGTDKEYGPIVNDKYIELEYIKSTGIQYIDTGLSPKPNRKIEVTFLYDSPDDGAVVFGCRGSGQARFDCMCGSPNLIFRSNLVTAPPNFFDIVFTVDLTKKHTLSLMYDASKAYARVDDNTKTENRTPSEFGDNHIFLFCRSTQSADSSNFAVGKLYDAKLYDDNTLIRNLVPAMRISDGKYGLYDKVKNEFYPNGATSGDDFIPGPFKYGLSGDTVHDFEVVESITGLPEKYSDSKYVPIHIKNQETGGPIAGYYIYDTSTDTIIGNNDTSGSSATPFSSGGSVDYTIYKTVDTKKSLPDDYTAKVELTGLGKIYFKLPSNSSHDWKIKNRIIPSFNSYNGYYDGKEHGISSYSFKDEDNNELNDVSIKFNTDGSDTYSIEYEDLPKYTDVGTYRIYYQATKTNYKTATGYISIVIKPKSSNNTGKFIVPNTGVSN